MWDKILEVIKELEPLLLVIIPTCFGVYIKIKNKLKIKKEEIAKLTKTKNKEKFSNWEHIESLKTVDKLRDICNYYKDIGHMDRVNYVQFENGTVASSKLCNMFLTCLAEDTRHSNKISHFMGSFQRIPYSRMSDWVINVNEADRQIYTNNNAEDIKKYVDIFNNGTVGSFITGNVYDSNGLLIGLCSFFYADSDWNGQAKEQCIDLLSKFVASVETIFLEYSLQRDYMKKTLNITE